MALKSGDLVLTLCSDKSGLNSCFIANLISNVSMYQQENTGTHILRRYYKDLRHMALTNLVKDLDNGKVNIYYEQGVDLNYIKETVLDDSKNLGAKLDIIDAIDDITDMLDIKDICIQLKELAVRLNIPIVVTSDMLLDVIEDDRDYFKLFSYGFDKIIDIREDGSNVKDDNVDKVSEKIKKVTFNVIQKGCSKIETINMIWSKDYCRFIENGKM